MNPGRHISRHQLLKLDRDRRVLGAVGNGSGLGTGQFIEATYMAWDRRGNIYSGDTSVGRVTRMVAPHWSEILAERIL